MKGWLGLRELSCHLNVLAGLTILSCESMLCSIVLVLHFLLGKYKDDGIMKLLADK